MYKVMCILSTIYQRLYGNGNENEDIKNIVDHITQLVDKIELFFAYGNGISSANCH